MGLDGTEKIYTYGYGPSATQNLMKRSAENNAAFFLPHLKAGMSILDCGCGPGSITIGLAQAIAPGEIVGLDIEESQLEIGRRMAAERGLTNVHFEGGSLYDIPFPDDSFDAVFGHTILMQFQDPMPVLAEIHRVLKPEGVAGFREIDFSGNLYEPSNSIYQQLWELFARMLAHNGSDAFIGRRLGTYLGRAKFSQVEMSAVYAYAGNKEGRRANYEYVISWCQEAEFIEQAIGLGWIEKGARKRITDALQTEQENVDGFNAFTFCEVVGRKESNSKAI